MDGEVMQAFRWFVAQNQDVESRAGSYAKNLASFFGEPNLLPEAVTLGIASGSAVEIDAKTLSARQVEFLIGDGIAIRTADSSTPDQKIYELGCRQGPSPVHPAHPRGRTKQARDLSWLVDDLTKRDLAGCILRGWYARHMVLDAGGAKFPLLRGRVYWGQLHFDQGERSLKLTIRGEILADHFDLMDVPDFGKWSWEPPELGGGTAPALSRKQRGPGDEFTRETLGEGALVEADLKYEIELLEYQLYNMDAFNVWQLGETQYKLGLAYYKLAHANPEKRQKRLKKALDAFEFSASTEYRNSKSGKTFLPRLLETCRKES